MARRSNVKVKTVKPGFTLIELLVVIAIIALLLSVVMPALGKAKIYAQKVICSSNMRQQALGVTLYASEHDSMVPIVQPDPANWFWDVTFWTTNQISKYAGFDDNKVFFCTANKEKKPDDARFWQFSMISGGTEPVPLQDESGFTVARQKTEFRVLPVLYMFEKLNDAGNSRLPTNLLTNQKPQWISKLSKLKNTGTAILLMDNVISDSATGTYFFQVQGGSWTKYQEYDTTNHKSNKRNNVGNLPDGANIGYADGHVSWKQFEEMQHQLTMGVRFYW
jgi:prepilin-type N-terminal cleavage/methylation domain-containing protein/prepilin-type processing-associated H-X9-DG protein